MHQDQIPWDPSAFSLPPNDYIAHLVQVTDYHINRIGNCSVFDPTVFLEKLARTSSRSPPEASELWQVEQLSVIALGKLLLERGVTSLGPPGVREFLHGIKKLPPGIFLHQEPITAIETLCLLAIYAQAVDMHRVAYLYVRTISHHGRSHSLANDVDFRWEKHPALLVATKWTEAQQDGIFRPISTPLD
ncbi:hypothetical protein A1O3_09014 [Capronia epimyces CBS 606.96]|uniref:Transcription factor domain-containing protein n=1 Tax=Capronia epimyces CBS 606.96 TaxID=1182542 RepID=W9XKM1_9EURO|nr:uncharacterized protein A1O3_09014 [Capronia epimyces CBS 606.96]EXJ77855.1 hypothetical protein A1O3_09014 [Capronia epimyces CBS 606.96]